MGDRVGATVRKQVCLQIGEASTDADDFRLRDQVFCKCGPQEGDGEIAQHRDNVLSEGGMHADIHRGIGKSHDLWTREDPMSAVLPDIPPHVLRSEWHADSDRGLGNVLGHLVVVVDQRKLLDDHILQVCARKVGQPFLSGDCLFGWLTNL